jgi:hypothetical protein
MKWVGHVACMGEVRNVYKILVNLKGRHHLEDLGIDRKVMLEWILGKLGEKLWDGFIRLKVGTSGRLL